MNPDSVPVLTFVGLSGTGKTTLLEQLIPLLRARGLRVAVVKHDVHGFQMDTPGKDTYRFSAAGAQVVAIANAQRFALVEELPRELRLSEVIGQLPEVDLVLTEGYKRSRYPKIELHRKALRQPLLTPADELLAVLTDEPVDVAALQLSLADVEACAQVILDYVAAFRPSKQ